ncbi:LysR family transcriptional regulator [Pseudomonas syringae]|uniref:LysR family transcriptional regulator n=1 Tax=Pseudomonas syringae TaxID=317 RepID=UPI003F74D238
MTMTPVDGSTTFDVNNLFRKPRICFDWEDLRYFVMFSTVSSLSGAARMLGVEHATVSRRIASLERSLNVKLVDRRKRLYELTDEGRRVAAIGRQIEAQTQAVGRLAVAAQVVQGVEVTISAPPSVAVEKLVPQLGAFRAMHPGIMLRLLGDHQYSSLSSCQSDLCIRFSKPVESGIVARRIGTASFSFYCARFYLEQRLPEHYEFIAYDHELMSDNQNGWLRDIVGDRPFVLEAKTVELQIRAAETGVGIALLPSFAVEDNNRLCRVELSAPLEVDVWLGVHEDLRAVASIQAAMNYVESCYL